MPVSHPSASSESTRSGKGSLINVLPLRHMKQSRLSFDTVAQMKLFIVLFSVRALTDWWKEEWVMLLLPPRDQNGSLGSQPQMAIGSSGLALTIPWWWCPCFSVAPLGSPLQRSTSVPSLIIFHLDVEHTQVWVSGVKNMQWNVAQKSFLYAPFLFSAFLQAVKGYRKKCCINYLSLFHLVLRWWPVTWTKSLPRPVQQPFLCLWTELL